MGYRLEKDTAAKILFMMVDATDDESAETGETVTVTISKNGAAFAALGGSVAEVGNGFYSISLNTTDTNTAGPLGVLCTGSAGSNLFRDVYWVEAMPDANVGTIEDVAAEKIADIVIRRTWTNVCASSDGDTLNEQSLGGVLAAIVGDWSRSGNTVTLYESDGVTSIGTIALTTGAGSVNPVVSQAS